MLRQWFGYFRWYVDAAWLLAEVLLGSDTEDSRWRSDPLR